MANAVVSLTNRGPQDILVYTVKHPDPLGHGPLFDIRLVKEGEVLALDVAEFQSIKLTESK